MCPGMSGGSTLSRDLARAFAELFLAETEPTAAHPDDPQQLSNMRTYPRDKALAEIEPTAAPPDCHSQQPIYMSTYPRDMALPETEPTVVHANDHT